MAWLDNSRFLAIYAVVMLHVAGGVVIVAEIGTYSWWIGNAYDSILRWSVPVFVMISGALLLDPSKSVNYKCFYQKRLNKILIPLIFWSAFFLFYAFIKSIIEGTDISVNELLKRLLSGKPHHHLWFLFMIFSLYIFTPFFQKIIASSSKNELNWLVSLLFLFSVTNFAYAKYFGEESKLFLNWFLLYIPFFFLGYLIRVSDAKYSSALLIGVSILSILITAIGCYYLTRYRDVTLDTYFYGYLSISVVPMSISMMYLFKKWKAPFYNKKVTKKLSALSFGVYLVHPIFLESINYLGFGAVNYNPAISVPIISLFVFSLSLLSAWCISKVPYLRKTI
jgi:surface polysaccharide O-acyltransferase-like enzyme